MFVNKCFFIVTSCLGGIVIASECQVDGDCSAEAKDSSVFLQSILTGHEHFQDLEQEDSHSEAPAAAVPTYTLSGTPVTSIARNKGSISQGQWPEEFCINLDVTVPSSISGSPDFALVGGASGQCNGIYLYLRSGRKVGFGVQCNAGGSEGPFSVDNAYDSDGSRHQFSFCYNVPTKQAKIYVDGTLKATAQKTFNFPRSGSISIFSGLHHYNHEVMSGATLHSFTITKGPQAGSGGTATDNSESYGPKSCLSVKNGEGPVGNYHKMVGVGWCRDDASYIIRPHGSSWNFCSAKNCFAQYCDNRHRAGVIGDKGGKPAEGEVYLWGPKMPTLKYGCQAKSPCSASTDQASCSTFRCAWTDGKCQAVAMGEIVEVCDQQTRSLCDEDKLWKAGNVVNVVPLTVVKKGEFEAKIWAHVRKAKVTMLECLAEKECWKEHFGNNGKAARACLACKDPNKPVSKGCQKYRECLRTQRSMLSDKSNTLIRNINLVAGLEPDVAGLLEVSSNTQLIANVANQGKYCEIANDCDKGSACKDPTNPDHLAAIQKECNCITAAHEHCDGAVKQGDTQQGCLRKVFCKDPRVCNDWKRAGRQDAPGHSNCALALAQEDEKNISLGQIASHSLEESLTTKKTC